MDDTVLLPCALALCPRPSQLHGFDKSYIGIGSVSGGAGEFVEILTSPMFYSS
jgi:hypothetical protein